MNCYICEKDINPEHYFEYEDIVFCCRGCIITYNKHHNDMYVIRGGENEYMTEELWGYPKDNLLDKIDIYNSIYPKDEYNTTQSKIYKDEDDIGFKINIKRLKTKK